MKKIIFLIAITFLILQSCSSGEDNIQPQVKNDIKPPYTVSYEVSFSSGLQDKRNNTALQFASEISPGKFYFGNRTTISDLSKTWIHRFTVTVESNPLYLDIFTDIEPVKAGHVNFKIYVNDILVENVTTIVNPRTDISSSLFFGASYWVY
jgi:hypothetical protein